jgi:hypothetical protein
MLAHSALLVFTEVRAPRFQRAIPDPFLSAFSVLSCLAHRFGNKASFCYVVFPSRVD